MLSDSDGNWLALPSDEVEQEDLGNEDHSSMNATASERRRINPAERAAYSVVWPDIGSFRAGTGIVGATHSCASLVQPDCAAASANPRYFGANLLRCKVGRTH